MTQRDRVLRVVALCGAICAAAVTLGASGAASTIRGRTAASNRAAAVRGAERLLGLVVLPPGAVRLAAEPHGDGKLLIKPPQEPTGQIIDRYGWWRVPATFGSVVAFLRTHQHSGSRSAGSGSAGGPGVPSNKMLSSSFPAVGGVISMRTLTFYAVALRGGETGVRVDAQETWILPRPASEKVPAGVHVIAVKSARPGLPLIVSRIVTAPTQVRRIISWIDRMQILQPGAYGCPELRAGQPIVTFDFRTAPGRPIVAQARLTDYGADSGPCDPISFTISGRPQKPLIGGNFLSRVQHLLGVRFR